MGWAAARQCLHARSQDWVTSQIARNGASSKFNPPRAGMLCIGCMDNGLQFESCGPAEERNAAIPIQKITVNKAKSVIQITYSNHTLSGSLCLLDKSSP